MKSWKPFAIFGHFIGKHYDFFNCLNVLYHKTVISNLIHGWPVFPLSNICAEASVTYLQTFSNSGAPENFYFNGHSLHF